MTAPVVPTLPPSATETAVAWLKRNAVVLLPLIVSILQAIDGLSWKDAIPVVVGIILRQFFTSPTHEVEDREAAAYREGLFMAEVRRSARDARQAAEAAEPDPPEDF